MIRPVSIIIPWIRKTGMNRCMDAVFENAGLPSDMFEIIAEEDKDRIGCPRMVRRLVEKTAFDMVCFLGDDTIPERDFLINAVLAMATLPEGFGLVGLNDGFHTSGLATHWLADKRLLPLLGGEFFHTGYRHCFSDTELTIRCQEMSRYVWAEDARIVHNHPMVDGKVPWDPDYVRVYNADIYALDRVLHLTRKRKGWPQCHAGT